jgi:hypothetical protein
LEGRARERHDRLDLLSSERNGYRDQYNALDALFEAVQTDNGWLEYLIEAMHDELLEQDARAAEDASTVEKVRMSLLERDEALLKAREDLAEARPWRRSVRQRWPRLVPSSNKTARPSRERVLGRARPKRRPKRLRS